MLLTGQFSCIKDSPSSLRNVKIIMKKFIIFIIIASVLGLLNLSYAFEVENLINKNEQTGHMMVIICIALSLITLGFLIFAYLGKGTGTVNKKKNL